MIRSPAMIDAEKRAMQIIREVSGLPSVSEVSQAPAEQAVDNVEIKAGDAFAKFKAGSGSGVAKLFGSADQYTDRATELFMRMRGEPLAVQGILLAKLIEKIVPTIE